MARTPWAIIKLCLPCWLLESAPYKQAFMLFLSILIPPLLLSPFLLSPLLILLLLSLATVIGTLSAWISVKASRMVLKHTIPLHHPLSLSSCLKLFTKVMETHIFGSFPIANSLPWTWLWFVRIPFTSQDSSDGVKESPEVISAEVQNSAMTHEGEETECSNGDQNGKQSHIAGGDIEDGSFCEAKSSVTEEWTDLDNEKILRTKIDDIATSREENKENVSVVDWSVGSVGSVPMRGTLFGGKFIGGRRGVVYFSKGHNDSYSSTVESVDGGKKVEETCSTHNTTLTKSSQDLGEVDVFHNFSLAGDGSLKENDQHIPPSDSDLRKLPRKSAGAEHWAAKRMQLVHDGDQEIELGPRERIGKKRYSIGCSSHSWCQKGVNLEEELILLVEDIHSECLGSWYSSLSSNEEFPLEVKILLDVCVRRAATLGKGSDVLSLSLKLGSLFLCHLREFRKSRRKKRAADTLAHEAVRERASTLLETHTSKEETAVGTDGSHTCTPERPSVEPQQLGSFEESSQTAETRPALSGRNTPTEVDEDTGKTTKEVSSKPATPLSKFGSCPGSMRPKSPLNSSLGEEAYYRLRFGPNTSKKNVHGHYLMNLSVLLVRDFVSMVDKLPVDPEVKYYFKDFGSSLVETPPGKMLVSMIARKVFYPLVDTVSDPHWLNARIASLLIDHVGAKVSLGSSGEDEDSISYFASAASSVVTVKEGSDQESSSDHRNNAALKVEKCEEVCVKNEESTSREERRKSLSLPLEVSSGCITNPIDGRISSVLGGIISATAGPLLPDNVGISYKPIKRMWSSPSVEEGKELDGEHELKKKVRPFGRHIVDGLPVYSSALSGRAVMTSSQLGAVGDAGHLGSCSSTAPKRLNEACQKKSSSSVSSKKPVKKKLLGLPLSSQQPKEAASHGGLFRSKSSHDVQASNEENWHIEQGSEMHEGAYLSDDPGSPLGGNKEDRDYFGRKSARSRSFHGTNYSRQRETFRARWAQKQEYLARLNKQLRCATSNSKDDGDIVLKLSSKREKQNPFVSSEDSVGEENDTVFHDDAIEFGKGLRTHWVKYSNGKLGKQGSLEEDSDQPDKEDPGSCQVSVRRGNKINFLDRGVPFSEKCGVNDVPTAAEKNVTQEVVDKASTDITDANPITTMDVETVKTMGAVLKCSSPLAGVEDDNMKEVVEDISPVYEEVEDLPSTVAKLKAFLKERNGSQKSEDSAPSSAEGTKKEFESLSSLELSLDQDASQMAKPQPSPLEERPPSWPFDGGIFLNVRIPYTEIGKGTSGSQSSNPLIYSSPHVFYCIEYDAAYPEEGADAAIVGFTGEVTEGPFDLGARSEEGRKDVANSDNIEAVPPSPGTVINHVVVKHDFQEFLDLHAQLEADPLWREALKGLKGPSRWLNLPFGKASASTVAGRRTLLQAYLRGVCTTMPQLASHSKALRLFMGYQGTPKTRIAAGETLHPSVERVLPVTAEGEGSVPRIDKFFARTVSGMFNTLKTALPGFDSQDSTQQSSGSHTSASSTPLPSATMSSHLDPSSAPAALGEAKTTFGPSGTIKGTMMQLPAFLQFGNSKFATYPDLGEWDMDYSERDSGGFNSSGSIEGIPVKTFSLEEDVQAFLERLSNSPPAEDDVAEFAFDALDPANICEDEKDYDEQSLPKGSTRQYLMDSADEDGEEEELDAFLPLCKMAINILCEALRGTGSWVSQGTVIHASKVLIGSFMEEKLQGFLKGVTTKEMWCHYVHVLRVVLFHPPPDLNQCRTKESRNKSISGQQLATAILTAFPLSFRQLVGNHELSEAAKFIADSLQNKVILRELALQVLHICITHLVNSGKRHLAEN